MTYTIRLEQIPARHLAVLRRHAAMHELPKVIPECCGLVWNVVRSQQLTGAGRHVAVYLDHQINLEVGVELDGPFAGFGEVILSATPAGLVATTTHFGPYSELAAAHGAVQNWCQQNGHKLAGPSWEIYGHWQEECNTDPTKIRTDIYYLLTAATDAD